MTSSYNPSYSPGFLVPEDPLGDSCSSPKPSIYYESAIFCKDVTVTTDLDVLGVTRIKELEVDGEAYTKTLILNQYDGRYYYVLASKLPKTFVPPPVPVE